LVLAKCSRDGTAPPAATAAAPPNPGSTAKCSRRECACAMLMPHSTAWDENSWYYCPECSQDHVTYAINMEETHGADWRSHLGRYSVRSCQEAACLGGVAGVRSLVLIPRVGVCSPSFDSKGGCLQSVFDSKGGCSQSLGSMA
jgi:hypothetical protein